MGVVLRKAITRLPLIAALLTALFAVGPVAAVSAEGRQLVGEFCTNPQALPKPGACLSFSYGGETAAGSDAGEDAGDGTRAELPAYAARQVTTATISARSRRAVPAPRTTDSCLLCLDDTYLGRDRRRNVQTMGSGARRLINFEDLRGGGTEIAGALAAANMNP